MPSPTSYVCENPTEDPATGDLLITIRVRNAAPRDKIRLINAFPAFVGLWPIRGFTGILRAAGALLALFA